MEDCIYDDHVMCSVRMYSVPFVSHVRESGRHVMSGIWRNLPVLLLPSGALSNVKG